MSDEKADKDLRLECYKLEYEKAAERYQEIYRSLWAIFSYLTAVSAALLAFGADKVDTAALSALALLPLVFWYWTTYLPLDRYANNVLIRLKDIEAQIKKTTSAELRHYTDLAFGRTKDKAGVLWNVVAAVRRPAGDRGSAIWNQTKRARFAITVFFLVAQFFFVWHGIRFVLSGRPFVRSATSQVSLNAPTTGIIK